ncbi:MAG TPA: hypothetical protein PKD61_16625 [Polyangiaceae bacterium]|nr:hypothetical protein [Polyangiaceae bacterium]
MPTPTWTQETRICSGATPAAGSCAPGQTCLPQPGAPYDVCVYRSGNMACPAGYTKKSTVYDGFADTRSCSTCSCGAASSKCGGSVRFTSGCSGFVITHTSVSGCAIPAGGVNISTAHWAHYAPDPSGTCPASTPTLTGAITPTGEVTVCCM